MEGSERVRRKRGRPRGKIYSESERKERRKALEIERSKSRIYIADQIGRWNAAKEATESTVRSTMEIHPQCLDGKSIQREINSFL